MAGIREPRKLLEARRFGAFWAADTSSRLGDGFTLIGLTWFIVATKRSAESVGLLFLAQTVPPLVLGMFAGSDVDRYSRRAILLLSSVARGLIIASLALLAMKHRLSLIEILGGIGLSSVLGVYSDAARLAVVPELAGLKSYVRANSKLSVTRNAVDIAGRPAAGAVVAVLGVTANLWIDAGSFFVAAGLLSCVTLGSTARTAEAKMHAIREGVRQAWRMSGVRQALANLLLLNVLVAALILGLPLLARDNHLNALGYGAATGGMFAGQLIAAALASRIEHAVGKSMGSRIGLVLAAAAILLAAAVPYPFAMYPCIALAGFGAGVNLILATSQLQMDVPSGMLGRIGALRSLTNRIGPACVFSVFGVVIMAVGTRAALVTISGVVVIAVALSALATLRVNIGATQDQTQPRPQIAKHAK